MFITDIVLQWMVIICKMRAILWEFPLLLKVPRPVETTPASYYSCISINSLQLGKGPGLKAQ